MLISFVLNNMDNNNTINRNLHAEFAIIILLKIIKRGSIRMWKWEAENDAKGVVVIAHNILEHTGRYAYVITMLRRNGYHVIMGDLPGQGQTSRANKGQIENFQTYHESLLDWLKIANEYKIPTYVLGVGLGGLILLNLLEKLNYLLKA